MPNETRFFQHNITGVISRMQANHFPTSFLSSHIEVTENEWLNSMAIPPIIPPPVSPELTAARGKLSALGLTDEEIDALISGI